MGDVFPGGDNFWCCKWTVQDSWEMVERRDSRWEEGKV